jgi:hypothetical protein
LSEILSPQLLISSIALFLNIGFGCSEKGLVFAETRELGNTVGSIRRIENEIILVPMYELANKAVIEYAVNNLQRMLAGP